MCESSWGYVERKLILSKVQSGTEAEMPVIQQSGRQMQGDPCELLEARLVYLASLGPARGSIVRL